MLILLKPENAMERLRDRVPNREYEGTHGERDTFLRVANFIKTYIQTH